MDTVIHPVLHRLDDLSSSTDPFTPSGVSAISTRLQSRTFYGTGCASDSGEFGGYQAAASKLPEGIL